MAIFSENNEKNILTIEPDDPYVDKAEIDLASNTVTIGKEVYSLGGFAAVRLRAVKSARLGLHSIATFTTPGGYTDYPVTLEGTGFEPIIIGKADVEYSRAYKVATKLADFTGLPLDNDYEGRLSLTPEDEPLNLATEDIPVIPVEPPYMDNGAHSSSGSLSISFPRAGLNKAGVFFYGAFFLMALIFPMQFYKIMTKDIGGPGGLQIFKVVLVPYLLGMAIPVFFALKKIFTRETVTVGARELIVERRVFSFRRRRSVSASEIQDVSLHYDPWYGGDYQRSSLFKSKRTPPIIVKSVKKTLKFGAGAEYDELLYIALRIKDILRR